MFVSIIFHVGYSMIKADKRQMKDAFKEQYGMVGDSFMYHTVVHANHFFWSYQRINLLTL